MPPPAAAKATSGAMTADKHHRDRLNGNLHQGALRASLAASVLLPLAWLWRIQGAARPPALPPETSVMIGVISDDHLLSNGLR